MTPLDAVGPETASTPVRPGHGSLPGLGVRNPANAEAGGIRIDEPRLGGRCIIHQMLRFGVIFGLLLQSLVAICCGNLLSSKADACSTAVEESCCGAATEVASADCCSIVETDSCCSRPEPSQWPSDCECCIVGQDTPLAPADPTRRYSGDLQGAAITAAGMEILLASGSREPLLLALRHEPPWRFGRALLADQCRWNL